MSAPAFQFCFLATASLVLCAARRGQLWAASDCSKHGAAPCRDRQHSGGFVEEAGKVQVWLIEEHRLGRLKVKRDVQVTDKEQAEEVFLPHANV